MEIYLVAIVVSLVLIAILFFALRSTVKRIDYNTKKYFIDKLQDYDYLIEEKQKEIKGLDELINKNKEVLKKQTIKNDNKSVIKSSNYHNDLELPSYRDDGLFEKYKGIKEKFSYNYEEIIKEFLNSSLTPNYDNYKFIKNVREKMSNNTIYKVLGLKKEDQIKYINSLLTEEERNSVTKILKVKNFKTKNFVAMLDAIIEKNNPTVYVYTGIENNNYNYLSPIINTVFDKNINEGIKIIYKGRLYDYSI